MAKKVHGDIYATFILDKLIENPEDNSTVVRMKAWAYTRDGFIDSDPRIMHGVVRNNDRETILLVDANHYLYRFSPPGNHDEIFFELREAWAGLIEAVVAGRVTEAFLHMETIQK